MGRIKELFMREKEIDKNIRTMNEFQKKYFPSKIGVECPCCGKTYEKDSFKNGDKSYINCRKY